VIEPALAPLPLIRILLVEDNPSDVFVVSGLLGDNVNIEYEIHHARTQSDALAMLAENNFDVCLLDLTLPDTSGFSALIDIQEKAQDMPVLILTGFKDTSMAKRAVGRGAQDYLLKDELEKNSLMRAIDYAIERKHIEKSLFQRANYDALTGLANRNMFLSRLKIALARSERSGSGVAILFIDLDNFKPINDMHGHDAGDAMLKSVAQEIKSILRTYDTAARFGGDEFAVLLEGIASPRDAASIAQKIIRIISSPLPYNGFNLKIGVSIGIAFSNEYITPDMFIQHADIAMYHAKRDGGNSYRFYAADMHEDMAAKLSLEDDLHTALSAGELRLYYQPYIDPGSKEVLGVEALLRWKHPKRGLLSAYEFLTAAEEARIMPQIGKWIFTQIRQDIATWNAYNLPSLCIAINLSVSQLDSADLLQWIEPVMKGEFLGKHKLAVEIPEEAIVSLSEPRFKMLAKLSEMGIALHLDNFGRGAFSLAALNSLPFSLLKLDMSLIQNMNAEVSSDALIHTGIMIAHFMGMKVGAVGVETPWQEQKLKTQNCDIVQGFLTVKPMMAEQFLEWLLYRVYL
jgi:diguanylate cyclase (GGDEF)-like protein